jgi:predicted flap endonuclease-1-like 5' DNA nuclease
MSLLYAVVFASRCRSNHHRLAVDALRHLQTPQAEHWRDLLLHYHVEYLAGAKAPDEVFKDFKNHVLHVRDKDWGGAVEACEEWYRRTVRAIQAQDWKQAAWSAGVMSHYYVDPLQPFHTHQTEEENVIHRAVEWSFSKSYKTFQTILERERGGYPDIVVPQGDDWLAQMVRAGANASTKHYETIIEHYDFQVGAKDPPAGLDQELKDAIAGLVGHAAVGFARILDCAFTEAAMAPPRVGGGLQAFFLALEMPIQAVLKTIDDAKARAEVEAQYEEFQRTGKVRATLGEDDKVVRALYATEVLKTPLSSLDAKWPREIGAKAGSGAAARGKLAKPSYAKIELAKPEAPKVEALEPPKAEKAKLPKPEKPAKPVIVAPPPPVEEPEVEVEADVEAPKPAKPQKELKIPRELPIGAPRAKEEKNLPRFTLDERAPVEKAPSIGPKTAKRLEAVGVRTIADLLAASADEKEEAIGMRHISAQVIRDWQAQALLACTVPGLKSREAQALVACGVRDANELEEMDAVELCEAIARWGLSEEGQRAWGNAPAPNEDDIQTWIERARRAHADASAAA